MNKQIQFICLLVSVLFISCSTKTYYLKNGITRVPIDNTVYANKSKFTKSLTEVIDTTVVYEEYDSYHRVLLRLRTKNTNCCYTAFKFYGNGLVNEFILWKEGGVPGRELDPEYNGFRGNYYAEDGKIKMDLFIPTTELRDINKRTQTLTVKEDTLYATNRGEVRKYVKSKFIPQDSLRYRAEW